MAKKRERNRRLKEVAAPETCFFCDEGKDPTIKEHGDLEKFLSERGKILAKERSGLCSTHQRKLSLAIKQARYLGLLPYTPSI